MNAALRDVAHLADTISTRRMDDQQIRTISKIRYIVHDCLIDVAGSSQAVHSPRKDIRKKKRVHTRDKESVRRKATRKRGKKDKSLETCLVVVEQFRRQKDSETDHPCLFALPRESCDASKDMDDPDLDQTAEEVNDEELPQGLHKEKDPIPLSENGVSQSSLDSSDDLACQSDLGVVV